MSGAASKKPPEATVMSLAQLLEQQPASVPPCLVEPGLLPSQGILFVGGEPKGGKSLLAANLALSLAAGSGRTGFSIPAPRRVLICQFELPVPQFVARLAVMRRVINSAADQNLFIDTRATGHLLCAPQGMNHFLAAAKAAAAEVILLDPLYSTHDQDENDTRPWQRCGSPCCACAMLPKPRSSWCIMYANRSRVSKSAAPSVVRAPSMR